MKNPEKMSRLAIVRALEDLEAPAVAVDPLAAGLETLATRAIQATVDGRDAHAVVTIEETIDPTSDAERERRLVEIQGGGGIVFTGSTDGGVCFEAEPATLVALAVAIREAVIRAQRAGLLP
ncbi:MAG TPA: hypothetical protein VFS05_14785 [Gemmatimonadaceae bacterium]|nr:hypothetical protein [Gemmatimonadaceae bacterium]